MIEMQRWSEADVPLPSDGFGVVFIDLSGAWRVRLADGSFVPMMQGAPGQPGDKGDKGDKGDAGDSGSGGAGALQFDYAGYLQAVGASNQGWEAHYTIAGQFRALQPSMSGVRIWWGCGEPSLLTVRVWAFVANVGWVQYAYAQGWFDGGMVGSVVFEQPLTLVPGQSVIVGVCAVGGVGNASCSPGADDLALQLPYAGGGFAMVAPPLYEAGNTSEIVPGVQSTSDVRQTFWPIA